jgi:hypothetical protein
MARRGTSDQDRSDDARGEGRDRVILRLKDNIFQSSILCNVHYYSQMIKSHFVFFAELKLLKNYILIEYNNVYTMIFFFERFKFKFWEL